MATKTKLKPCPHCGSKDAEINDYTDGLVDIEDFPCMFVMCNKCGSGSGFAKTASEAKRKWNRRSE